MVSGGPVEPAAFIEAVRHGNDERYSTVVRRLRDGEPLEPPVVVVGRKGESTSTDGAHRVAAALELGVPRVPVVVVNRM